MEKIEKRDDVFYYGERRCVTADAAYRLFRDEYHKSLGKRVYKRLERYGARTERIHGFGIDFTQEYSDELDLIYYTRFTGREEDTICCRKQGGVVMMWTVVVYFTLYNYPPGGINDDETDLLHTDGGSDDQLRGRRGR